MRKAIKTTAIVIVFLTATLALAITAGAGVAGFSVHAVLPENQDPAIGDFFDLWVTPGQEQEIILQVVNYRDEPITVHLELFTAGTTRSGILSFAPDLHHDESLPFRFEDIARLPPGSDNLEIPAGTFASVPINFTIPAEGFDGMVLGGIDTFLGMTQEEMDADPTAMFIARFAIATTVRLRIEGRPPGEVDFDLGEVYTDIYGAFSAFVLDIHHKAAQITRYPEVSAWIYFEGHEGAVFTTQSIPVEFAPNAIFSLTKRDTLGVGITPGNYTARVLIEYDGRTWEFERAFTVTAEEAEAINEEAIVVGQQAIINPLGGIGLSPVVLIAIGAGLLLLILLVIILLVKSRKGKGGNGNNNEDWNRYQPPQPPQPRPPAQRMPIQSQPVYRAPTAPPPVVPPPVAPPAAPPPAQPAPPAENGNSAADQLKGLSQEELARLLAKMKDKQNGQS